MAIAGAIAVIGFGAILTFALAGGSVSGIDLRVPGVILMLCGALGLLLPLLHVRSRWSQSTARSRQDAIDDLPPLNPAAPSGRDARRRRDREPPGNRLT
ncbi:hypothetical protein [Nonomuraea diastatica]|uniref:Uncharacterized protein n=1 Tax=Nonomuraea diastatica TaxID=1848329 RepID=A0A4R4X127_9ACTN|nr:hypothetical protein [Nonomuraea diastatica]TDD23840.1 hypothetical protein E1294_07505 [Nonomuraea diastatica]